MIPPFSARSFGAHFRRRGGESQNASCLSGCGKKLLSKHSILKIHQVPPASLTYKHSNPQNPHKSPNKQAAITHHPSSRHHSQHQSTHRPLSLPPPFPIPTSKSPLIIIPQIANPILRAHTTALMSTGRARIFIVLVVVEANRVFRAAAAPEEEVGHNEGLLRLSFGVGMGFGFWIWGLGVDKRD